MKKVLYTLALVGALGAVLPVHALGVDYLVAACDAKAKKCAEAEHVIDKWPMLKGTPFASQINGAIDPSEHFYTIYSGNNAAEFNTVTGEYHFDTDNAFASAPAFLRQGADTIFDLPLIPPYVGGASVYIKNDTGAIVYGDWQAEEKLAVLFPGLAGTLFSRQIDAAVPVPGTNLEQIYLFSGGYVAVLNLKTGQLSAEPKKISDVWQGFSADYHGVQGALPGEGNTVYLFTYKPQNNMVTPQ